MQYCHQMRNQIGPYPGPNQTPPKPPPPHNPFLPNAPMAAEEPPRPQLHWSHFKPKYAGKLEEDAEVHLLRMNDWMDTHNFQDHMKVQRFCRLVDFLNNRIKF